jgi:hypothetical protein
MAAITPKHYLSTLYRGIRRGHLSVWHKRTNATKWFSVTDLDAAESHMLAAAEQGDAYFGWGIQDQILSGRQRGTSKTVIAVPGILFDADLKATEPGIHAKNNLPESLEEVLTFLGEIGFLQPTAIRSSGNGLYLDWLLPEPQVFQTDQERESFAQLSRRLHTSLIRAGMELRTWDFDNTSDLARVTRMPGTLNHKTRPPKPVSLLNYDPDRHYTLEQIAAAVESLEARFNLRSRTMAPTLASKYTDGQPAASSQVDDNLPLFQSILNGCAFVREAVESADTLKESFWYATSSIVGYCKDGLQIFRDISKPHPKYSEEETDAKLAHAIKAAGPRTCENIRNSLGFQGCSRCPFEGKIKSPIRLGYQLPNVVSLMQSHIFDVSTRTYVELGSGIRLSDRAFSDKFRHLTFDETPHHALVCSPLTRKVDRVDYIPGDQRLFMKTKAGPELLNMWRDGGVEPCEGDASLILNHFDYMIPNDGDRTHLLDGLAYAIQHPANKLRHAFLVIGKQGIGKSFIAALLKALVGEHNVKVAESEELLSEWTASLGNIQALVVEELMTFGKLEVYNRLKTFITEEAVNVNEKHIPRFTARTPRLILAFSNHSAPISIQQGDRRFHVIQSPATPRDKEYYSQLFAPNGGLGQAGAFRAWLQSRNISHFDPSAPPPMTDAKLYILKRSRLDLVQELEAMMDDEVYPFCRDLILLDEVAGAAGLRLKKYPSNHALSDTLRELGAVKLNQVRLNGRERARPWAWRNTERWESESADEIRDYILKSRLKQVG